MAETNAVVGIYNSHTEAEAIIKELQRSGFDMKKLSTWARTITPKSVSSGYYSQDGGHTWSSNPQLIIGYGRRKKISRLEFQKRFERIDERKELAGVPPPRDGFPRLPRSPLSLEWPIFLRSDRL